MNVGPYRFDRVEFAGSLGDLGTLVPLSVALVLITGLSASTVYLMVGLFYIAAGIYYRLPIPVQPLKVVSAIAIASPGLISVPIMAAAGIEFGIVLILLAATGVVDMVARLFSKAIVRGIQLGLGFILVRKGIDLIRAPVLFVGDSAVAPNIGGVPVNLLVGCIGVAATLLLLTSKRFPAALTVVAGGIAVGVLFGGFRTVTVAVGPTPIGLVVPGSTDFLNALVLLVIPQIPLTIGNAVIGTADTCCALFGNTEDTRRGTYRSFSLSMGLANIVTGFLGGMPMCHGAGGLAAHYRFGARTGGSNIMIGLVFLGVALVFGKAAVTLLTAIPNGALGVLLLFAGLELALLIRDTTEKRELFVALLIAGVGLATTNMAIAFGVGMMVQVLMRWQNVEL